MYGSISAVLAGSWLLVIAADLVLAELAPARLVAAGAAGAAVGVTLSLAVPEQHKLEAFLLAVPAACGAIIAFGVVAYLLDDGDLRAVLAWVQRVTRLRS